MTTREDRLRALSDLHQRWVADHIGGVSAVFEPSAHTKPGSDYNQHHVDIDADGAVQDDFFAEAMRIFDSSAN